jgi:hypothetical protein
MPENTAQQEERLLLCILKAIEDGNKAIENGNKQAHKDALAIIDELDEVYGILVEIAANTAPAPELPTSITFKENIMGLPTVGGNTLVYTGTLSPAGAVYPSDSTFTVTANDPAILPTVDSTGLVVTVPLPAGWVESTTTPLAISYAAASASNPTMAVSATITPSAPPAPLPTGITFVQTT